MRSIFLLGGFFGFSVVLLAGWIADRPMPGVLRDAALGCLLMAFVFRWGWSLVIRAFRETVRLKRQAEQEAAEAAAKAAEASENQRPAPAPQLRK